MSINYTSVGEFNNNIFTNGDSSDMLLSTSSCYSYNNGCKFNSVKYILSESSATSVFDNNHIIQPSTSKLVLGETSTVNEFNNRRYGVKQKFVFSRYSGSEGIFANNSAVKEDSAVEKIDKLILGKQSDIYEFSNNIVKQKHQNIGDYSIGIFDIENNISLLKYDEYGYEEIASDLLSKSITFNSFDNSIPISKKSIQYRLIPWNNRHESIQFSINFPAYNIEQQFNISKLGKENALELSIFGAPPIDTNYDLEHQFLIELDKYRLELQSKHGVPKSKLINMQVNVLKDRVYKLNSQFKIEYEDDLILPLQVKNVYNNTEKLQQQLNIPHILNNDVLDMQFTKVDNCLELLDTQFEILTDWISVLDMQTLTSAPLAKPLELQNTIQWDNQDNLEVQVENVFKSDTNLCIQNKVLDTFIGNKNLNMQVYGTPPISCDNTLENQFVTVKMDNSNIEHQFDINKFISNNGLNFQWLQHAEIINNLDQLVSIEIDTAKKMQAYIIAVRQDKYNIQAKLLATIRSPLELMFDTKVDIKERLEIEFNTVVNEEYNLEFESNTIIVKDYDIDTQVNISNISKNESLELSYNQQENLESMINMQANSVVLMNNSIDQQFGTTISKNINLDLQLNIVKIFKSIGLDIQSTTQKIESSSTLDISFEILDLLFYMLYEGTNYVPWCSSGMGNWDTESQGNWTKNLDNYTMFDNLNKQINDLDLNIDILNSYDTSSKNFHLYENKFNARLKDKIVKLQYTGDKKYITIGKTKSENEYEFTLNKGRNIAFYDGNKKTFHDAIGSQINDYLIGAARWLPETNKFDVVDNNTEVFFYEKINKKNVAMPYIFLIEVSDDCSYTIKYK